jgi:hypothetical protein
MTIKQVQETGGKYLLITALFMVILQGGLLVTVTLNTEKDKEQERKIMYMWRDYMPTVFMEGMMKTYAYQTEAIVATLNGDNAKIKELNARYDGLRTEMLNNLQLMRGGPNSITRSLKPISGSSGTSN